jgi:hypothetical protein
MGQRVVSWHHATHNNDEDDFMSQPPVRPVREAFTSYGSRESGLLGWVDFSSSTGIPRGQLTHSLGTFVLHPCLFP